jgi:hypothetical protein
MQDREAERVVQVALTEPLSLPRTEEAEIDRLQIAAAQLFHALVQRGWKTKVLDQPATGQRRRRRRAGPAITFTSRRRSGRRDRIRLGSLRWRPRIRHPLRPARPFRSSGFRSSGSTPFGARSFRSKSFQP